MRLTVTSLFLFLAMPGPAQIKVRLRFVPKGYAFPNLPLQGDIRGHSIGLLLYCLRRGLHPAHLEHDLALHLHN